MVNDTLSKSESLYIFYLSILITAAWALLLLWFILASEDLLDFIILVKVQAFLLPTKFI